MALARRTWLFTLCLWLSLATVLGHALAPVGSPLAQKSGSAFSIATSDVSLGAGRAGLNAKLKRAQWPAEDGGTAGSAPLVAAEAAAVPRRTPRAGIAYHLPDTPSLPSWARSGFDARAPPRA